MTKVQIELDRLGDLLRLEEMVNFRFGDHQRLAALSDESNVCTHALDDIAANVLNDDVLGVTKTGSKNELLRRTCMQVCDVVNTNSLHHSYRRISQ